MDIDKLDSQMQFVERNGCCFNIEEKMKLKLAFRELKHDLSLDKLWFLGKITGIVNDYFMCKDVNNKVYWCSSSSWTFAQLPAPPTDTADLSNLASINTFFTGEFDTVLFQKSGPSKVIDEDLGIVMPPKPVTELDRLSFVFNQIKQIFAVPKGFCKFTPLEKIVENEAFNGLSKDEMLNFENWQFHRDPQDPEIQNLISRGEAVYNVDCLDSVAKDFPKNSWSIQKDVTGTIATLKSHLWQGFYAYHRCNTSISGYIYMGNGIKNENLPFMV